MKIINGELIGARITIIHSTNRSNEGITGTVIDETKNTFTIRTEKGEKKVTKKENEFRFTVGNETATVKGEIIARRPEDRIKDIK